MILVAGATGFLGRALLADLLARPDPPPIRALVRREFDAVRLREQGVEAVTGDVIARRGLDRAMHGATTLVYLVNTLDRGGDVVANELEAIQNTLIAARAQGVQRVIFLGSVGAHEASTSRYLLARWAAELAVRQSGLSWVVLRTPVILAPGSVLFDFAARLVARSPLVPLFRWRRTEVEPVALADVVEALRMSIDDAEYARRSFDICGAERTTFGRVVREWARVSGKHRARVPLPARGEPASAALAWSLGRLPYRETRLMLETLRERQVCADPSLRFPLPHRPMGVRAALETLVGG
jgi:uncharacterized protein YbjT (DUF2867 family)